MTAPLIGYGIRRHERGSFTAFSSRVDTLTVNETHGVNHTYSYTFGVDDSVSSVSSSHSLSASRSRSGWKQ